MNFLDRVAIAPGVYPFTPQTWEEGYPDRVRSLATTISADRAEAIPAVYACTTVVSEDIAKVPFHVYEDLGENEAGRPEGKRRAKEHEWYEPLHHEPNEEQSAIEFRELMTAFALNRGRGVARKRRRRIGGTVRRELYPLHPDLVTREVTVDGDERWLYDNPVTHKRETLLPDEVFVLWGRRRKSVLHFMREAFAIQLAMMELAGQTWRRGPRHTGIIQRPKEAPKWNDKARENFRRAIDEYMGEGERAGRPMLLEDGMTWESSGFSLHDADFLGAMQFGVADVCRAYRVPQHKIQELTRSTNNNISQQSVDYVVDSLLGWAVRWEQAARRQLFADPFFAEHNLRGLLRADVKTQAEMHRIYATIGAISLNEVREDEGRNPREGLDEPRVMLNTAFVDDEDEARRPGQGGAAEPTPIRPAASQPSPHHRALVRDAAARVVRKELQTLAKLGEQATGGEWERGVRSFYRAHGEFVAKVLRIPDEQAATYAAARLAAVLERPGAVEDAEDTTIGDLTLLALTDDRTPEGAAA